MSVAYIAGPITGQKDYKAKFARAARYVKSCGYDCILNPAEVLPPEIENRQALPICLRMIEAADTVFFMPDWSRSPGASIERMYASYIEKRVEYLPAEEKGRKH